jgi:hypothetical protein
MSASKVSPEWLTQRVENAPTSYHRNLPDMAALRIRMAWQKLKRKAVEEQGDEVWAFENPANMWKRMGKQTGYAIVRQGEIVESVIVLNE